MPTTSVRPTASPRYSPTTSARGRSVDGRQDQRGGTDRAAVGGLSTAVSWPNVVARVVEQHADGAAVWLRRDEAVRSLDYALRELAERDDRLDAHLQGLRFAGKATGKKPAMIDENVSPCT